MVQNLQALSRAQTLIQSFVSKLPKTLQIQSNDSEKGHLTAPALLLLYCGVSIKLLSLNEINRATQP